MTAIVSLSTFGTGLRTISNCWECPHRSPGFLSEPSTCCYGERKKTPWYYICERDRVPEHCPLRKGIPEVP